MDANNFMMQGGMPQPHMQQRPQPANLEQQIFLKVVEELRKIPINNAGLQIELRERANWVMRLFGVLRNSNIESDISKCVHMALRHEMQLFSQCPSRDIYDQNLHRRLAELQQQRATMMQRQATPVVQPGAMQPATLPQTPMQPSRSNQGGNMSGASFTPQYQTQTNQSHMQASPMNSMQPQLAGPLALSLIHI